jgi:hypothetical protein
MKRIPALEVRLATGVAVAGAKCGGRLHSTNRKDVPEVSTSVLELYINFMENNPS